jgi:hypothetical protein
MDSTDMAILTFAESVAGALLNANDRLMALEKAVTSLDPTFTPAPMSQEVLDAFARSKEFREEVKDG